MRLPRALAAACCLGLPSASLAATQSFLAGATQQAASVCGSEPKSVQDCDHADMGSCGNACCLLELDLTLQPEAVYDKVKTFLTSPNDGSYARVTGGDPNPTDDLREFNISKPKLFEFILQGSHQTPKYKDNDADVLNFNIAKTDGGSSLRMFSLSRIHGALGDAGQNYKTLKFLKDQLKLESRDVHGEMKILHGCGKEITGSSFTS